MRVARPTWNSHRRRASARTAAQRGTSPSRSAPNCRSVCTLCKTAPDRRRSCEQIPGITADRRPSFCIFARACVEHSDRAFCARVFRGTMVESRASNGHESSCRVAFTCRWLCRLRNDGQYFAGEFYNVAELREQRFNDRDGHRHWPHGADVNHDLRWSRRAHRGKVDPDLFHGHCGKHSPPATATGGPPLVRSASSASTSAPTTAAGRCHFHSGQTSCVGSGSRMGAHVAGYPVGHDRSVAQFRHLHDGKEQLIAGEGLDMGVEQLPAPSPESTLNTSVSTTSLTGRQRLRTRRLLRRTNR